MSGDLKDMQSVTRELLVGKQQLKIKSLSLENIVTEHKYSPNYVSAAAAAANAGTCLEDGDAEEKIYNVFANLVDAVSEV